MHGGDEHDDGRRATTSSTDERTDDGEEREGGRGEGFKSDKALQQRAAVKRRRPRFALNRPGDNWLLIGRKESAGALAQSVR